MKKKGEIPAYNPQSYVALMVFIIALAFIFYIMMLPPADRAELLEQNRTGTSDGVKDDITVLMTREPGTLTRIADTEIEQDIPSFNLYSRTDSKTILEFDSIYIKKSMFEEQKRNISFRIDNPEYTDNYVLSFSTPKHKGMLTITLNGMIIFSNEINTQSPSPIELPSDYLKENNYIVFQVNGPGIEFWTSNEYIIENMKIIADVTDTSSQENTQIIFISDEEMLNLESFELSFIVDCKASEVSPMQIYLNKRLIYQSVPDCGYKVEVPKVEARRMRQGENELLFRTERGNYLLYAIEGVLNLKEPIFPTYYFNLDQEDYDNVQKNLADVNITMLFTNEDDLKKATLLVNGAKYDINTYEMSYNRNVNPFVRKGNNAIEIKPGQDQIHILELEVVLAE